MQPESACAALYAPRKIVILSNFADLSPIVALGLEGAEQATDIAVAIEVHVAGCAFVIDGFAGGDKFFCLFPFAGADRLAGSACDFPKAG